MNIKDIKTKYEERFDASVDLGDEDWIARDYSSRQVWQFFCKSMIEVLGEFNHLPTTIHTPVGGYSNVEWVEKYKVDEKVNQLIAQLREEL